GAATGGTNTRTRLLYDRDGHVVATLGPTAFRNYPTSTDYTFMRATDYDVDGRPIKTYSPRYDGTYAPDLGLSSTQTRQCPTGASPQAQAYPNGVGVCITGIQYDADGNRTKVILPTAPGTGATTTLVR